MIDYAGTQDRDTDAPRPRRRHRLAGAVGGLLVALLLSGAAVPAAAGAEESAASAAAEPLTARTAAEFADEAVPAQLERHRIPGAAVSVVAGGEEVFAKGYGVADVASGRPVQADKTVFAPASVAKLLTATAVMQLVEADRIDLDADVNKYLDFEVDDTYPGRPVTTAHLLTHTAGFAVHDSGTAAETAKDIHPLGAHLAEHLPARIRPPGERAVYSNYGLGLAGYLVELRSGMPFHRYVAERILQPLGMTRTTFAQPTPAHIREDEAIGYRLAQGRPIPAEGATYGHMPPHGAGFRSTATDMARFMRAMLGDGAGILRPESVQQMQRRQFANAPGTGGMGYAFQEYDRNGQRLLVHLGSIPGSFAILALIPEHDIGLYASYNGGDSGAADSVCNLVDDFTGRFAPAEPHEAPPRDTSLPDPGRYAGTYRSTQIGDTADLGRIAGLLDTVTVSTASDQMLRTTGAVGLGPAQPRRWQQIAPGLFRAENGDQTIRFGRDGLLATTDPAGPLERLAWYEHPNLHLGVVGAALLVLAAAALGWPLAYAVRRMRGQPGRAPRLAAVPGWAAAVLVLGSVAAIGVMFADFAENQAAFFYGSSPLLSTIAALPLLGAAAAIAAAAVTPWAWRNAWWSRAGRVHHTAVVLAAGAYLAVAFTYNVPGMP